MINIKHMLQDWMGSKQRPPANALKTEITIEIHDNQVRIDIPDGRALHVEINNGEMHVQNYNDDREIPLMVKIPVSGEIVVAREIYDLMAPRPMV